MTFSESERLARALHSNDAQGLLAQAAAELRRLQAEVDHRINLYGELSDALGCDAMDSHAGRVGIAAKLRKDAERYREYHDAVRSSAVNYSHGNYKRVMAAIAAIDAAKEKP